METNRKREGLLKRKLMTSIYRGAKQGSSAVQYNSMAKPMSSSASSAAGSVGFIVNHHNYVTPQAKQKISFAPQENGLDSYEKLENLYSVIADESVDVKATSYISYVQERFRLE